MRKALLASLLTVFFLGSLATFSPSEANAEISRRRVITMLRKAGRLNGRILRYLKRNDAMPDELKRRIVEALYLKYPNGDSSLGLVLDENRCVLDANGNNTLDIDDLLVAMEESNS